MRGNSFRAPRDSGISWRLGRPVVGACRMPPSVLARGWEYGGYSCLRVRPDRGSCRRWRSSGAAGSGPIAVAWCFGRSGAGSRRTLTEGRRGRDDLRARSYGVAALIVFLEGPPRAVAAKSSGSQPAGRWRARIPTRTGGTGAMPLHEDITGARVSRRRVRLRDGAGSKPPEPPCG